MIVGGWKPSPNCSKPKGNFSGATKGKVLELLWFEVSPAVESRDVARFHVLILQLSSVLLSPHDRRVNAIAPNLTLLLVSFGGGRRVI